MKGGCGTHIAKRDSITIAICRLVGVRRFLVSCSISFLSIPFRHLSFWPVHTGLLLMSSDRFLVNGSFILPSQHR